MFRNQETSPMMRPNGIFLSLVLATAMLAQDAPKPPLPPRPPGPTGPAGAAPFQPARLEKPADPSKVRATYDLEGTTVTITEGAYFDALSLLQKFEGRAGSPVTDGRVYEHMLALAEANAFSLGITDEEFAATDPMKRNPALAEQLKKRWEQEGVTEDQYVRYQKESATVQRVKDLFANSMRVKSADVFDGYAKDHYTYKLDYVAFPAADFAATLANASEEDLKKFWDDDRTVQNMMRVPMSISAEFIWLEPDGRGRETRRRQPQAVLRRNARLLQPQQGSPERAHPAAASPGTLSVGEGRSDETRDAVLDPPRDDREGNDALGRRPGSPRRSRCGGRGREGRRREARSPIPPRRPRRPSGFAAAGGNRYGVQAFSALFNLNAGMMLPDVSVEGRPCSGSRASSKRTRRGCRISRK
jgi:hypothetical protein